MKRIVLIFIATACTALGLYAQPAPTYTLKSCLEQGLLNNYSLRIVRNEEQVSKNNATLGNAGYLPTLDLSAGYKGTIDNTETKARATGETTKDNGVFDQTLDAGINTPMSSRFVMKENYLSIESVRLGYQFDSKWLKKALRISSLNINMYMNSIARFSTLEDERGLYYPFARSISFSLGAIL